MKKLVIADDDFLVRAYLKQMIPWEEKGFVIAGDAKNGEEAWKLIEREHPSLLITDICMPVCDGLSLIKKVKEAGIPSHILVLSCHDDFDYVRQAMQLGIDDYLLKTELSPEKLEAFLEKHLAKETPAAEAGISTDDLVRLGREKLREDFFTAFTDGANDDLYRFTQAAGLPPDADCAALLLWDGNWLKKEHRLSSEDFSSVRQSFRSTCQTLCTEAAADADPHPLFLLLPQNETAVTGLLCFFPGSRSRSRTAAFLQDFARQLRTNASRYFSLDPAIVLTPILPGIAPLQRHWLPLASNADSLYYEQGGIYPEEKLVPIAPPDGSQQQLITELLHALQQGTASDKAASDFFDGLAHHRLALADLTVLLQEETRSLPTPWTADVTSFANLADLQASFTAWLRSIPQTQSELHPAIRSALTYIRDHQNEPLAQTDVADYVHLNPAYFSTLFKKSLGTSFSDYLAEQRLRRVRQRLLQETTQIKDIAAEEGFADYQYFCRLFKKTTGVSPSHYRRQQ